MFQVNPQIISDILTGVKNNGCLTLDDHYQLMDFTFDRSLNEQQRNSINGILNLVHRGKVKLVHK